MKIRLKQEPAVIFSNIFSCADNNNYYNNINNNYYYYHHNTEYNNFYHHGKVLGSVLSQIG